MIANKKISNFYAENYKDFFGKKRAILGIYDIMKMLSGKDPLFNLFLKEEYGRKS